MAFALFNKIAIVYILIIFILYICNISQTEGFTDKKVYHFHNKDHYGDNILNLKFLYNISDILKENSITINYYYNPDYIKNVDELERYVNSDTLSLHEIKTRPNDSIELWMGNEINGVNHHSFDEYYMLFYNKILQHLKLDNLGIDISLYQKESYLQNIYNDLDPKYKDLDILIINAEPKSGQFAYDKSLFDLICKKLSSKYKIATTASVNNIIPCTFTDGLKMQDIGAISTHAKYIIAIHSGPLMACYNSDTKNSVKKWIICVGSGLKQNQIDSIIIKDMDSLIDKIEDLKELI